MASALRSPLRFPLRALALAALFALLGGTVVATAPAVARARPEVAAASMVPAGLGWRWPVTEFRLARPYKAPAHRYGSGHRGVDLRPLASSDISSPADGHIAFSGRVADRWILTIDHGGGLVTTLEPIDSSWRAGEPVSQGDIVGTLALGGHTPPGALHFGVRLHGEYVNPLLLLGGVPRAVLVPCC